MGIFTYIIIRKSGIIYLMETQFKPIPPKKDYDKDITVDKITNFDDEFKNSKRQLLIKKIITRAIAFLILLLIIFFFFIRKPNKSAPAPEIKSEATPVQEVQNTNDINNEKVPEVENNKQSVSSLIPSPSPVSNSKTTVNTNTAVKSKLSKYEIEGYVTIDDNELIYSSCTGSEELLIVSNSPLYNQFYNRFINLTRNIYSKKAYVVVKGHNVPVQYSRLGSSYTQGFFLEAINKMDLTGSCY
jgi:hypothetical protein